MTTSARLIRRAARTLAHADMIDITVTDSEKNDDGSWTLLARDESARSAFTMYHRITLTIEPDEEEAP